MAGDPKKRDWAINRDGIVKSPISAGLQPYGLFETRWRVGEEIRPIRRP
ncbi:hypothetical protein DESC_720027 [Desulfosarcina cetonica]|nr:hypothetical protein DESC_720027 [Desulfosarcina cetonica]